MRPLNASTIKTYPATSTPQRKGSQLVQASNRRMEWNGIAMVVITCEIAVGTGMVFELCSARIELGEQEHKAKAKAKAKSKRESKRERKSYTKGREFRSRYCISCVEE